MENNRKSNTASVILFFILLILVAVGAYYLFFNGGNSSQYQAVGSGTSTSTPSQMATSSVLTLTSLSASSTPVGSTIIIGGRGFSTAPSSAEQQQDPAWTNSDHVVVWLTDQASSTNKAILWSGNVSSDEDAAISSRINRFLCTTIDDNDTSDLTNCPSIFALVPGNYLVTFTIPYLDLTSNSLPIIISGTSLSNEQYSNSQLGYTISYPDQMNIEQNNSYPPTPGAGVIATTFTFPKSYYPGGTVSEANVNVAVTKGSCTEWPDGLQSFPITESTTTASGIAFDVRQDQDAAAGNFYSTTEYSTGQNGQCYRIALFTHMADPGVYAQNPDLIQKYTQDDEAAGQMFQSVLVQMVQSFAFKG